MEERIGTSSEEKTNEVDKNHDEDLVEEKIESSGEEKSIEVDKNPDEGLVEEKIGSSSEEKAIEVEKNRDDGLVEEKIGSSDEEKANEVDKNRDEGLVEERIGSFDEEKTNEVDKNRDEGLVEERIGSFGEEKINEVDRNHDDGLVEERIGSSCEEKTNEVDKNHDEGLVEERIGSSGEENTNEVDKNHDDGLVEERIGSSGDEKTNEVEKDNHEGLVEERIGSSGEEKTNEVEKNRSEGSEANIGYGGETPRVGMTFSSEDEVIKYYITYASCMGFGVSRISSKNGDDGKRYFTIACNQSRKYVSNSKNFLKLNPTTETPCKARLNACVGLDGSITVSRVVLEHNHELNPTKSRYFRYKRSYQRSPEPRVKRKRSLVVEANESENLTSEDKDCGNDVNKIRQLRLGKGDVEALQNYFVRMQKQNSQFYYAVDLDGKSRLRNIFWADARCRVAYEYFGEVITFDTTYLTNKYDLPFVSFVGVNHHGQSVLLGCALLSDVDTKTYTWLFTTWLDCIHGRAPNAIITDEDRAMKNAIEVVFPKTRHRWCLWNLMKKVPEKLASNSDYQSIKTLLDNIVYDSLSRSDFMERWKKMIEYYKLQDNEWLKWIFDERHCWAPVYVRDTFWAGMSTTKPNESMDSFFDGYVSPKTTLKQFIGLYDYALKDKIEKEGKADFGSFNSISACVSHFGFESQLQKAFTNEKFKEFQVEVTSLMYCNACFERLDGANSIFSVIENKRVCNKIEDILFKVSFDERDFKLQCTCCLFEFKGILCRHILCVLMLKGKTESLPPHYILSQWRKDIRRRHTLIRCGFDHLAGNVKLQRVAKACDAFYEVAFVGIKTEDDFLKVMNWINNLKNELTCKETPPRIIEEDSSIRNQAKHCMNGRSSAEKRQQSER